MKGSGSNGSFGWLNESGKWDRRTGCNAFLQEEQKIERRFGRRAGGDLEASEEAASWRNLWRGRGKGTGSGAQVHEGRHQSGWCSGRGTAHTETSQVIVIVGATLPRHLHGQVIKRLANRLRTESLNFRDKAIFKNAREILRQPVIGASEQIQGLLAWILG